MIAFDRISVKTNQYKIHIITLKLEKNGEVKY